VFVVFGVFGFVVGVVVWTRIAPRASDFPSPHSFVPLLIRHYNGVVASFVEDSRVEASPPLVHAVLLPFLDLPLLKFLFIWPSYDPCLVNNSLSSGLFLRLLALASIRRFYLINLITEAVSLRVIRYLLFPS